MSQDYNPNCHSLCLGRLDRYKENAFPKFIGGVSATPTTLRSSMFVADHSMGGSDEIAMKFLNAPMAVTITIDYGMEVSRTEEL